MKILVLNGPNLNLLGTREPEIYGDLTLQQIQEKVLDYFSGDKIQIDWFQSNLEGELVEKIQQAQSYDGIIFNPAAYTHTSVALLDAIKSCQTPVVEAHLSNTAGREEFRKTKITTQGVRGVIEGFGVKSYILAVQSFLISGEQNVSNN